MEAVPLACSPNHLGAQFHSVPFQTRATFLPVAELTSSLALTAARAAEQHPATPEPGTRAGSVAGGAGAAGHPEARRRTAPGAAPRPVPEERTRSPAPRGGAAAGLRSGG